MKSKTALPPARPPQTPARNRCKPRPVGALAVLVLAVLALFAFGFDAQAATYYSQGSVTPTTLANWNTVRAGGGSSPANFTTAGDIFVVQSPHNMTTTALWTSSGTGTKVQIESGGTLTAAHIVTTPNFQVDNGGTYVHNADSGTANGVTTDIPGLTTRSFGASSTVEFQKWAQTGGTGPVALPTLAWGNLKINVTTLGGSWQQSGGLTTVNGSLTIAATGGTTREFRLNASSPATSTLAIGGDLIISGGIFAVGTGSSVQTVNIGGNFNQSGGTFTATSTGVHTVNFTGGSASVTFTKSAGTFTDTVINFAVKTAKTVTLQNATTFTRTLTVDSGGTFATGVTLTTTAGATINGTFKINPSGFAQAGTWIYGASSTLEFANTANFGFANTHVFWPTSSGPPNVNISGAGGVTMTSASRTVSGLFQTSAGVTLTSSTLTLNGVAQINPSGAFNNAPVYGASSTLIYNVNATYGRFNEWSAAGVGTIGTTAGYPNNVVVSNNTTLNFPNGSGTDRACAGNLTILIGSALYQDFSSGSAALTVAGNYTLGGSHSLGSTAGGDLTLKGNWSRTGTFTPNGRAVFFNGSLAQTLSGGTTFDYLIITNAAGLTANNSIAYDQSVEFSTFSGGATPPVTMASGVTVFLNSKPVTVTTTAQLAGGYYKLIAKSGATAVTGTPGTLTLNGSGVVSGATASLQVVSGELFLYVYAPATTGNYFWDIDGATAGAGGATPSGTWATSGTTWSTNSTGSSATSAYTTQSTNDLTFSAGTDASGSYTVTLGANQNAKSLTFEEGTATITANTATLGGGGGITVLAGAGDPIISSILAISGGNTFNILAGRTLTLGTGAFTRNTRAALNVPGAGTVTSTKTGLATGGMVNGIVGPWASFGTGTSTRYATFSGNNIVGLTGTAASTAANVTDTTGAFNYDVAAVGTLGTSANINTLRYTGAAGSIATATAFTTKGIMNAGSGLLTFSGAVSAGASGTEMAVNTANADITFSGILTGTINKVGSGTMTLGTAALHVIGGWTVNEGTLNLGVSGTADSLPGGTVNSGGTVKLNGGNSKVSNGGTFTINAGGTFDINGSTDLVGGMIGAGSIINGNASAASVQANPNGGTATFTGVVGGGGGGLMGFTVNGAGTQVLSGMNTYAGVTDIRQGSLSINTIKNVGVASSIGAPAIGNAPIRFGNTTATGTLVYTGTGDDSDRVINLFGTTGGGTITQSGASGLLRFNSNLTVPGTAATDQRKTLTLQGSTAGTGEIVGNIVDATLGTAGQLATSLTKAGTGIWTLSGVNTYTGATAVNGGTLFVNSPGSLASGSAVSVAASAALGGTGTINGTVNVAANGNLIPGGVNTIGTLTLANNSATSLTLNGNLPSSLTFDLPNSGTICDLIDITGASGALVLNGVNYLNLNSPLGPTPAGTYTLMNYAARTGSGTLTFLNGTTTMWNATLNVGATSVTVVVGAGGLTTQDAWKGTVSGVWDGGILNWTKNGAASQAFADGDAVLFDDTATTYTVTSGGTVSPSTMLVNNTTAYTISATIGGTGTPLVKTGSGTLTLSGTNTYTGPTTISAGTLVLAENTTPLGTAPGVDGTSGITINSGASVQANIAGLSVAAPITLNGAGDATLRAGVAAGSTSTFSGAIGGATGNLVYSTTTGSFGNASSVFVIGAAGNYTGNTLITTGNGGNNPVFLRNNVANALPATTVLSFAGVAGGGTGRTFQYDLNGNNQTLAGLSNTVASLRRQTVTSPTAATLTINNTADMSFGGSDLTTSSTTRAQITGAIALTKSGSGTFTLGGTLLGGATAGGNTHTGDTKILGGILVLGETIAIQNSTLDTLNSVAGTATDGLRTTVTTLTLGGLTGNKDFTNVFTTTTGGYTGLTALTLNPGSGVTNSYAADIGNGNGSMTLTKSGAGTQVLSGVNTYGGNTTISAGTLRLGAAGVIPNASSVSVTGTGTLDLNGNSETINGLSGNGTVDNSAASSSVTLTVGGGGYFDGAITNSGSGATLALVKSGNGADLVLAGNNSYSGGTTLNSGAFNRLFIASANALPTTGAVQVNSGATLNLNAAGSPAFNTSITLASGATLAMRQAATLGNVIMPTSGTVIFNRDDLATTAFSLGSSVALAGNLTNQVGGDNASVGAVTLGGVISGGFGLTKTEVGTLILAGTNTYSGDTTVSAGTLTLADDGQLKFVIGANGVNNQINGIGTNNLDGDFNLDLSGANTTAGNSWTLVNVGTLTETFGSTFSVTSTLGAFTETANVWTNRAGVHSLWTFTESTGVLGFSQPNNAPTAAAVTSTVAQGESVSITNNPGKLPFAADADADPLTFAVVTGPAQGTVSVLANGFIYNSTGSVSNITDTFTYSVADGFGGAATNTMSVIIGSAQGANLVSATALLGKAYLIYAGIPGQSYVSELATNLLPPITWTPVATNTAGAIAGPTPGMIFFTNDIVSPASFFRTQAQ